MMRLQKYMALAGVDSRRKCEALITAGKVKVNGRVANKLGTQVNEQTDIIHLDNRVIRLKQQKEYYIMNKPRGYISAAKDDRGRKTVLDLMPRHGRLYPVGRLDRNTSGLLIITDDGELTNLLTHPREHIPKTYVVKVTPVPDKATLARLRSGGTFGDLTTQPCQIQTRTIEGDFATYEIVLHEGQNRQIRRMFEFFQHRIVTLRRTKFGELKLKGLPVGKYRKLDQQEMDYIMSLKER